MIFTILSHHTSNASLHYLVSYKFSTTDITFSQDMMQHYFTAMPSTCK